MPLACLLLHFESLPLLSTSELCALPGAALVLIPRVGGLVYVLGTSGPL